MSVSDLAHEAARSSLDDAQLTLKDIDAVVFATGPECFEGVNCPDKWAAGESGGWGKPFMRINTGGATGGSGALAAISHVASGAFDVVLVIAMQRVGQTPDAQRILNLIWDPVLATGFALNLPAIAAMGTTNAMQRVGYTEWHMAKISEKAHLNALNNPYAHVRFKLTLQDVLNSRAICWPIKLLDCCPRSEGACAAIFASEERARKITSTPAWVIGTGATTCCFTIGEPAGGDAELGGPAIRQAYKLAGIDDPRRQIDVVECYDPFSNTEIGYYYSMGFCQDPRDAVKLVEAGFGEMTGEVPFNPSGGVLCSNPIGATAMVRVVEAALQVMGKADQRQVPDARVALATGAGGSPGPGSATFMNAVIVAKEPR